MSLSRLLAVVWTVSFPAAAAEYEYPETRWLVDRVKDAAQHLVLRGESAFSEFRVDEGPFRNRDFYIFVLDPQGTMRVHPDPLLEGKNALELTDVHGRKIVRGLLDTVYRFPGQAEGFFHYEWPVPKGLLPRWKSTFVQRVTLPSGEERIVGAGLYSEAMERAFVMQMVEEAAREVARDGEQAFARFRNPRDRFWAKDSYVFVFDESGVDRVNPGFPNLEGRNLLDVQDARGKRFVREMWQKARTEGAGFVDYDWPRPQDNRPTRKSAYVKKVVHQGKTLLLGCGAYLKDAVAQPAPSAHVQRAEEVMKLVREAAAKLAKEGPSAFPAFRKKPSRWFHNNTYLFVWNLSGLRVFHAANPKTEGEDARSLKDLLDRPIGEFILEAARSERGEGWAHYLYPEPDRLFPIWKSTFVKKVLFPDGTPHLVGCGVYQMAMEKPLVEDLVQRAAHLVKTQGTAAFATLRDPKGPFFFMDTYVFVDSPDGREWVNPAQPSLEGRNLSSLTDAAGKPIEREILKAARNPEGGWLTYLWYRPTQTTPQTKHTFVKAVDSVDGPFIVGSGFYAPAP